MNKFTLTSASILLVTLTSFSAYALDSKAVAAVNGKTISQEQYQQHLKQLAAQNTQGKQAPVNRQMVLDELINREILVQEAKKLKLDKNKNVIAQLELLKNNLLIQALIARSPVAKPVTDQEVKDLYDKQVANANPHEYKARHILVKDEDAAKKIIEKLNNGASFEETAKADSIGPSGKDGGDIGWFSEARMAPEFFAAASKMIKGTHSQTPVKTEFGYHVIKLEDSRTRELPKFEDIKDQIRPVIQNQRLQKYVLDLRSKAKIEVK